MLRRSRALVLIMAFVFQTLALLSPWSVAAATEDLEHLTLHALDGRHHHHGDQSLHVQDAEESVQHQHADGGPQTGVPLATAVGPCEAAARGAVPQFDGQAFLSAAPDGLLRPPRLSA